MSTTCDVFPDGLVITGDQWAVFCDRIRLDLFEDFEWREILNPSMWAADVIRTWNVIHEERTKLKCEWQKILRVWKKKNENSLWVGPGAPVLYSKGYLVNFAVSLLRIKQLKTLFLSPWWSNKCGVQWSYFRCSFFACVCLVVVSNWRRRKKNKKQNKKKMVIDLV